MTRRTLCSRDSASVRDEALAGVQLAGLTPGAPLNEERVHSFAPGWCATRFGMRRLVREVEDQIHTALLGALKQRALSGGSLGYGRLEPEVIGELVFQDELAH
jgi:hypothetical protein